MSSCTVHVLHEVKRMFEINVGGNALQKQPPEHLQDTVTSAVEPRVHPPNKKKQGSPG